MELNFMMNGNQIKNLAIVTKALPTLVAQGLRCFPCYADKTPATPHGYKDASSVHETVQELWRRHPGPLIGVATGEMSGIDVLDIDPRHGGAKWFAEHKSLLTTRVHQTRSGGFHLFFQHESGLRCSAGRIAAGIDVRADGGYVIWWPAVGLPVTSEIPVARWPHWLLQQLSSSPRGISLRSRVPDDHALAHLIRLVAGAREGERNNLTFWAACRAGELVASRLLKANFAIAIIAEAAARSGLPRAEAERTAWNGIKATSGISHA
jgi:Bifunctional DNA primase/polymerase, N-terminal